MNVDVRNLQNKVRIDKKEITRYAGFVLKEMGRDDAELSLLFVSDSRIKSLNKKYLKINSKTDVLAFPINEGRVLGDVVISAETAKREATKRNVSVKQELNLYLIHGILHLLGYDDQKSADRKKMKAKEKKLLEVM